MPEYGLLDASSGRGLLPWSWAEERLSASHNYWVATARPEGRPHVMPVWGVWLDGAFYFSTAQGSRKIRNLAGNPQCVVSTERADEAVIVEGEAARVGSAGLPAAFKQTYDQKYDWDIDADQEGFYAVRPRVAFGFIEHADQFRGSATRWRFPDA
ncbi:MAG: pyridoxamine 5'-phosphate oxidase family protein [Dehalococcoidia bacterium]|nr:pyridoxamine 5'-phosphate oxidase family protein [Dehalococcoidia bacterium]